MDNDQLLNVGKRFGDISDLPEALRKQLNVGQLDDLEEKIIQTLKTRYQCVASVDEILIGLYRDFGFIGDDRKFIANKLYRMTKSGILRSVKKRKGVYEIENEFPKLVASDLKNGLYDVKYNIEFSSIEKYLVNEDSMIDIIKQWKED